MAQIDQGPDEFEVARQRASQQSNAAVQSQKDAMKRRFAASGSLNSGAALKQNQLVEQEGAQRLQQANEGINAQEQGVRKQEREADKGRQFQTSERVGSQDFAAGQGKLGREFQTSERLGSQDFTAGQANTQRDFMKSERLGSQDFATNERLGSQNFSAAQNKLSQDLQKSQFTSQMDMANKQFEEEKRVNTENLRIADQMLNQKDFLDRMLGPVPDLLGGGIGAIAGGANAGNAQRFAIGTATGGAGFGGGGGGVTGFGI